LLKNLTPVRSEEFDSRTRIQQACAAGVTMLAPGDAQRAWGHQTKSTNSLRRESPGSQSFARGKRYFGCFAALLRNR